MHGSAPIAPLGSPSMLFSPMIPAPVLLQPGIIPTIPLMSPSPSPSPSPSLVPVPSGDPMLQQEPMVATVASVVGEPWSDSLPLSFPVKNNNGTSLNKSLNGSLSGSLSSSLSGNNKRNSLTETPQTDVETTSTELRRSKRPRQSSQKLLEATVETAYIPKKKTVTKPARDPATPEIPYVPVMFNINVPILASDFSNIERLLLKQYHTRTGKTGMRFFFFNFEFLNSVFS